METTLYRKKTLKLLEQLVKIDRAAYQLPVVPACGLERNASSKTWKSVFLVLEFQREQWKAIQAVHPRLTWASQDEERCTEFLLDDDSPLVQPTVHAPISVSPPRDTQIHMMF